MYKLCVLLLIFALECSSHNILFFHVSATLSHRTAIWPLATRLADAGHNISYIFPLSKRPGVDPRIEEIKPSLMIKMGDEFLGAFNINFRLNRTTDQFLKSTFAQFPPICEAFYNSKETIAWLARPNLTYDLVLLDGGFSQCIYPLVYKFKAKHIIFNPATLAFYWDIFGVVPETSTVPEMMFLIKPEHLQTSLWSRTINTLAIFVWNFAYVDTTTKTENLISNKLNLSGMPSFMEMDRQASLVLHNTYFIEDYPMSLPPMFVSYSGLSCTKKSITERKPLEKNLENFIAKPNVDGFVYISFGSSVNASAMPESLRDEFMTAFAAFPNLRFLWKWTGLIPENMPKNVLLQPWFPQLDVLAHPKIKAFVTQAGRPSTQEALCYGVPMITIPIFAEQDINSDKLVTLGAAISLDINSLTSDQFIMALKEVVNGNKYRERAQELSKMFRDRPMDPIDYVHYWVEYVLRHNTSILKPLGMQQTWYQRRLLDVYAFILLILLIICSVVGFLLYKIVKIVADRYGVRSRDNVRIKID